MFLEGGRLDTGSKLVEFEPFAKIGRLFRDVAVTEKLDGTNAAVGVTDDGHVYAQSRKAMLSTERDNFGFAGWVKEHVEELLDLGPGLHHGEWWGLGINRGYGLDHKRFSLFNVNRWEHEDSRPPCCDVVPVLARVTFSTPAIRQCLDNLYVSGSVAAPGFRNPEGVVVYHRQANHLYKVTIENDERGKEFGG